MGGKSETKPRCLTSNSKYSLFVGLGGWGFFGWVGFWGFICGGKHAGGIGCFGFLCLGFF